MYNILLMKGSYEHSVLSLFGEYTEKLSAKSILFLERSDANQDQSESVKFYYCFS